MREIRRKDREISTEAASELLATAEYGILSTVSADGEPYGVPLNYVWRDQHIYFHCATSGHKLDNIAAQPRVSFCVVGQTRLLPELFATEYESAIAFGQATEAQGEERSAALVWLLEKYCPDFVKEGKDYILRKDQVTRVIKIKVDQVSGKARR